MCTPSCILIGPDATSGNFIPQLYERRLTRIQFQVLTRASTIYNFCIIKIRFCLVLQSQTILKEFIVIKWLSYSPPARCSPFFECLCRKEERALCKNAFPVFKITLYLRVLLLIGSKTFHLLTRTIRLHCISMPSISPIAIFRQGKSEFTDLSTSELNGDFYKYHKKYRFKMFLSIAVYCLLKISCMAWFPNIRSAHLMMWRFDDLMMQWSNDRLAC